MPSQFKACGGPCRRLLPLAEFGFKNKATGRLQSKCKDCSREYAKQHYQANRETYVEKARVHNLSYRERNTALIAQLLTKESCAGCGTRDDLTYYAGGVDEGQPVYMAVHAGLSEETVLAAVARSTAVCRTCLGAHFGKSLEFWRHLNSQDRSRLQAERERDGHRATPKSYFKAYRRTDGTIADGGAHPAR